MFLNLNVFYDKHILLFYLIQSCGRDKVVILWDLQTKKQLKTIALYDSLESMVLLPEQGFYLHGLNKKSGGTHVIPDGKACVAVGGEKGKYIVLIKIKLY